MPRRRRWARAGYTLLVLVAGLATVIVLLLGDDAPLDDSSLRLQRPPSVEEDSGWALLVSEEFQDLADRITAEFDETPEGEWPFGLADDVRDAIDRVLAQPTLVAPPARSVDFDPERYAWIHIVQYLDLDDWEPTESSQVGPTMERWRDGLRYLGLGHRLQRGFDEIARSTGSGFVFHGARGLRRPSLSGQIPPDQIRSALEQIPFYEPKPSDLKNAVRLVYEDFCAQVDRFDSIPRERYAVYGFRETTPITAWLFRPQRCKNLAFRDAQRRLRLIDAGDWSRFHKVQIEAPLTLGGDRLGSWLLSRWQERMKYTCELNALVALRFTRVFLATRLFVAERNRYPNALEELVPDYLDAVPIDPWSSAPLRYDVNTRAVYSVGPKGLGARAGPEPVNTWSDIDSDAVPTLYLDPDREQVDSNEDSDENGK